MTRRMYSILSVGIVLISSGCQSANNLMPWQASREPQYTAEQVAAMNNPQPAAAKSEVSVAAATTSTPVQNVSHSTTPLPTAAGRIDQLVQAGQAAIRDAGQNDPVKLQEARQLFEEALAVNRDHATANHGLAIVADLQKDWPTAQFHYKQALSQRPQDPSLLNDLGYSYVLQNRFHEAAQYLNQALQVSPQHERAHINLALLSLKRGDRGAAQAKLAGIYAPAEVQRTLAKLEKDVQQTATASNTAIAASVNGSNMMPANAWGQNQPGIGQPSQPMVMSQQQMSQQQMLQQQYGQAPQVAQRPQAMQQPQQQNRPISVYPPGLVPEMETQAPAMAAQGPLSPQAQSSPGVAAPSGYTSGMPQQNGLAVGQPNNYTPGYPANNFAAAQPPQQGIGAPNGYPGVTNPAAQPLAGGMAIGGVIAVPGQTPQVPSQIQGNAPNIATGYGTPAQPLISGAVSNAQPAYGNAAANRAPVMGLNAGPGALFPIQYNGQNAGAVNGARAAPQPATQPVPGTTGSPVTPNYGGNGAYPNIPQAGVNGTSIPNAYPGMQVPSTNRQPVQNGSYGNTMTQQPATTVSVPQNGAGQNLRTASLPQQPGANHVPAGAMNQQQTRSPLAAYEQQLQNLDGQYNRALQQMNGRGLPANTQPAGY